MKTKLMVFGLLMAMGQVSFAADAHAKAEKSFVSKMKLIANEGVLAEGKSYVFDKGFFKDHPKIRDSSKTLSRINVIVSLAVCCMTPFLPLSVSQKTDAYKKFADRLFYTGMVGVMPLVVASRVTKERSMLDRRDDIKRQVYATGQCANLVNALSTFGGYPIGWVASGGICVAAQGGIAAMSKK